MSRVYACFWFDVEDYITPESDDALKALLDIFVERGARGTWKIVGEKYRVMRDRGRSDIMALLHKQDVGYHTENHSRHPTISEYVTGLGWQAGVEEFYQRERPGFEELKAEFGTISCYGQPGGSWAPQAFPVLARWGIPMYLDEGNNVGLGKQPFWFQNILTAFNLRENCIRADIWQADKAQALEKTRAAFNAAAERLKGTGGLISIYYHPCEFATSAFWDGGVNFGRGRNTPRERWQGAPLLSPEESAARLDLFAQFLDLALNHPDVEVVDATELLGKYRAYGPAGPVPVAELSKLAADMGGEVTYGASSVGMLSPAEILSGLLRALSTWSESGSLPDVVDLSSPLGPTTEPSPEQGGQATVGAVAGAARAALTEVDARGHLPSRVALGAGEVGPVSLFVAASAAVRALLAGGSADTEVEFRPQRLVLEDNVARDDQGLWGWSVFPEGFKAPDLTALTRLQAWTLKPAELR